MSLAEFNKIDWNTATTGEYNDKGKKGFIVLVNAQDANNDLKIIIAYRQEKWFCSYFEKTTTIGKDYKSTGKITIRSIDGRSIKNIHFLNDSLALYDSVQNNTNIDLRKKISGRATIPVTVTAYSGATNTGYNYLNSLYWLTLDPIDYSVFFDNISVSSLGYSPEYNIAFFIEEDDSENREIIFMN